VQNNRQIPQQYSLHIHNCLSIRHHSFVRSFIHSFIHSVVLREVHWLFHTEFSTARDLLLLLSIFSIAYFPYEHAAVFTSSSSYFRHFQPLLSPNCSTSRPHVKPQVNTTVNESQKPLDRSTVKPRNVINTSHKEQGSTWLQATFAVLRNLALWRKQTKWTSNKSVNNKQVYNFIRVLTLSIFPVSH
jgi:hypothetical protein